MLTQCAGQCLVAADWRYLDRWQWWYYSRRLVAYLRISWCCFWTYTQSKYMIYFQLPKRFLVQQNGLCSLLSVLRWRMAPHYAAVLQTPRRPRVQVWSYIPTKRAMVSAGSPSCTALTVTMICHQSLYPETLPLLENCESKWWLRVTIVVKSLCLLYSYHVSFGSLTLFCLISDMERTWLWLHLLR